jgi:hypothetical protein
MVKRSNVITIDAYKDSVIAAAIDEYIAGKVDLAST